ncbi:MAG: YbaN family protein [Erysipelotrichaceae bacterium]
MKNISKLLTIIMGFILLIIGSIGVVLPILPHTPFLIGAVVCFAKSSKKLETWLKNTKLYRNNIESFIKGQGMSKASKVRVVVTLSIFFAIALFFMQKLSILIQILLVVIWLAHVIGFIFFVKTKEEKIAYDD